MKFFSSSKGQRPVSSVTNVWVTFVNFFDPFLLKNFLVISVMSHTRVMTKTPGKGYYSPSRVNNDPPQNGRVP